MQYAFLGRSGLKVSRLSLGTYNFGLVTDEAEAFRILDTAVGAGITLIDTADQYPGRPRHGVTEQIIGRWLNEEPPRRERIILATKVYHPMPGDLPGASDSVGISKHRIRTHFDASLRRLHTDHIDLYQLHHVDRRTPWDEVWESLEMLLRQGRVDYVGTSNCPAWQLAVAQCAARSKGLFGLVSEQHRYNLLCRLPELEVLPAAGQLGIGLLAYGPLMGGLLGGVPPEVRGRRGLVRPTNGKTAALADYRAFCLARGCSEASMAVAWLLHQPHVGTVILGPRTVDQLLDSLAALSMSLDRAALEQLDAIFPGPGGPAPEAYAW